MGIRLEVLSGTIDGVNLVFVAPTAYESGSARLYVNGLLVDGDGPDGFTESNPSTGEVTLKEAPSGGGLCPDVLQLFYEDQRTSGASFTPILAFDVEFFLSIPAGVQCFDPNVVSVPRDIQVETVLNTAPGIPAGFLVDVTNPAPAIPAGLSFVDLEFVSIPKGVAVNEV